MTRLAKMLVIASLLATPNLIQAQTATQMFDSEAAASADGWTGFGNRINNFDFGFSATNNAQGASGAGEAGGQIARSLPSGYYADTSLFGRGDLNTDLHATGRLKFEDVGFDGEVFFGWFDRALAEMDIADNLDFLGLTFREPNNGLWRVFASIDDEFATADHGPLGNQLNVENDVAYDFVIDWDADGGAAAGSGKLTVTLDEVGGPGMFVSEAEGFDALSFDAFGMMTNNQSGNPGQIANFWFDDLEYSLVNAPFMQGDVNADGVVDRADFEIIRANFLQSVASSTEGDLNSDGIVDNSDFRLWKANRTAGAGGSAGVPEPSALAITVLAAVALVSRLLRGRRTRCCIALFFAVALSRTSLAQAPSVWVPAGVGNWNEDANWSLGFVPVGAFGDTAIINNGGTAQVTDTPAAVGSLSVGPGRVEVQSGGSLSIAADISVPGTLTVTNAGSLSIASGGAVDAESASSAGTIELNGPAADFNVATNLGLSGSNTLVARITGPSLSPISVGGAANLGGALDVQLSGVSPSLNDSWNLIDASTINGDFDSVAVTGASGLAAGQVFAVRQQPGGTNGNVAQLFVDQRLVLNVDRATGMTSITNPGAAAIELDGYTIRSSVGSIDPAKWNSLQDQGFDGGDWFEFGTGGTQGALAELNPDTVSSLAPAATASIGAVFDPNFVTLGQETEDLEFVYTVPGRDNIAGVVNYVGDKQFNNLVLTVNPQSGEATLQNESEIPVSFDVYTITSASGSLLAEDGDWNSLQDQGLEGGDWLEIDSNPSKLGEVKVSGVTTLNQEAGFNLGNIFDPSGSQDLVFRFLLDGQSAPFDGVVVYGQLPVLGGGGGLLGDYNNNGQVEQGDLDLVLLNWGQPGVPSGWTNDLPEGNIDQAELDGVLLNWGNAAALGSAASVPEPASVMLLGFFLLAGLAAFSRRVR